jgi:transposase
VSHYREAFVGIDVAKLKNAIAVAEFGRDGEIRYFGEVESSDVSMRRVIQRIAAKFDRVHFCYEAGPTGYGLYRLIKSLGHECIVVAPSLIPRKPGDRVKTNRRDALALARLLRAGELTAVWVPDEGHEAMRDLVRARTAAVETLRVHRQQISAFMLKHGRSIYPRKKGWTMRYLIWLQEQRFDHPAHQIALQEMVDAVRVSRERVDRLEKVIEEFVPNWSLAPIVQALQALRGVDLVVAVTFATEIGDVSRFESPRQLMGYLGLVPGERSTGETTKRGGITKAGNSRVRTLLVENAWTYRCPPRIGSKKLYKLEKVPSSVREIAWKAQSRLSARYRLLTSRGKKSTVVCTAIARARWLYVGCFEGGPPAQTLATTHFSRIGGGGTTVGELPFALCGRHDRRPQ